VRPGIAAWCDHDRMALADGPGEPWLAIGLSLTLVPTAAGGRQTPLLLAEPFRYRPNWGLPGMTGTEQTGAPVLCSSASVLAPGGSARVVVIPLTDAYMTAWCLLNQGDQLRMFEGPQICGNATVQWTQSITVPVPAADQARFLGWANSSDDQPGPT